MSMQDDNLVPYYNLLGLYSYHKRLNNGQQFMINSLKNIDCFALVVYKYE